MSWTYLVAALVGGSGVAGLIQVLVKVRPEASQIVVTAAQGAVVVQSGVIERLDDEIERLQRRAETQAAEIDRLRDDIKECAQLHAENERLQDQVESLANENKALRDRVRDLEDDLAKIKRQPRPPRDRRQPKGESG